MTANAPLERTRSVLHHNTNTTAEIGGGEDVMPAVIFTHAEEPYTVEILLDRSRWEDLGSPATITLTIEPGDLLNTPTEDET